jgi:6-phosphogluconolactonase (cycloisomerase 2 family)
MSQDFHLIDLVSQAIAVQRLLAGKTESEKLAWLAARGKLEPVVMTPDGKQTYHFEAVTRQVAAFFFDSGDLVFVGDHTTFTVSDD